MLLESFKGCAAGLYVCIDLIGKLQHQPFKLIEASGALPILDSRDLFIGDADVLGSRHMLGPFVDRMAILGGAKDRDFAQFWIDGNLAEERVAEAAADQEDLLRIGSHLLNVQHDPAGLKDP